jgi:hypothetical protein
MILYALSYCLIVEREMEYSTDTAGLGYPYIYPTVRWDRSNKSHWVIKGYTPIVFLHRMIWPHWWEVKPQDYRDYASKHPWDEKTSVQLISL